MSSNEFSQPYTAHLYGEHCECPECSGMYYQHRVFVAAIHAHQTALRNQGVDIRRYAMALTRRDQLAKMLIDADIAVGSSGPGLYPAYCDYINVKRHRLPLLQEVCDLLPRVDVTFAKKRVEIKRETRRMIAAGGDNPNATWTS